LKIATHLLSYLYLLAALPIESIATFLGKASAVSGTQGTRDSAEAAFGEFATQKKDRSSKNDDVSDRGGNESNVETQLGLPQPLCRNLSLDGGAI
jgi:hypothetical protein